MNYLRIFVYYYYSVCFYQEAVAFGIIILMRQFCGVQWEFYIPKWYLRLREEE